MPRFFFCERGQPFSDPEGVELPNLATALAEAAVSSRQIVADELHHGPLTLGRSLDIMTKDGQLLGNVSFVDALFQASSSTRTHSCNDN